MSKFEARDLGCRATALLPWDQRARRRSPDGSVGKRKFSARTLWFSGLCREIARKNLHHRGTEIAQRTTEFMFPWAPYLKGTSRMMSVPDPGLELISIWPRIASARSCIPRSPGALAEVTPSRSLRELNPIPLSCTARCNCPLRLSR